MSSNKQVKVDSYWFGPDEQFYNEGFEDLFTINEDYKIPPAPTALLEKSSQPNIKENALEKIREGAKMGMSMFFNKEKNIFNNARESHGSEVEQREEKKPSLTVVPKQAPMMPSQQNEVTVVEPRSFEDSMEIVSHLKENKSVIMNLQYLDHDTSQRVIDFVSGATYSLDGTQQRVGQGVFIFATKSCKIEAEDPSSQAYKDIFAKTFGV